MSVIKKETIDFRRVGTALIGGDFTGNARGANAIDIQTDRTAVTQVASGEFAIAIGRRNTASNQYCTTIGRGNTSTGLISIAIGYNNTVSGYYAIAAGRNNTVSAYYSAAFGNDNEANGLNSVAVGSGNVADGDNGVAIGNNCNATANNANALGLNSDARVEKTTNICGPQINKRDSGEAAGNAFESFGGVVVTLMSKEVDMEVVADHTITLPANAHFWLDEVGIIATNIVNLVTQPTVRYGITGDLDKHGAAAITTDLTATNKREIETPLVPEDGETSLTGGVTIAADADTFLGRFYWKGMFIEDE